MHESTDQFFDYMIQQATKLEWKVLLENKSKFLLVHSSSGHKHALKEILSDSSIASRLADTKASSEVKALDTFYSTLQNEPDKAYYGIEYR
ncbi:Protein pelota-like [Exaiptasia diaphana]|nr:Protein pelota-like [Exaiptasia diaphana]